MTVVLKQFFSSPIVRLWSIFYGTELLALLTNKSLFLLIKLLYFLLMES